MAKTQNWKQELTKAFFAAHGSGNTDVLHWVWFERGWTHLEALFVPFCSSTHPSPPGKQWLLRSGPASTQALALPRLALSCLALSSTVLPCLALLCLPPLGCWAVYKHTSCLVSDWPVGCGHWGDTTPAHVGCPQAAGMHVRSLP